MSRKGYILKRNISPDPVFNSKIIAKLINQIMEDGKKNKAQKILYTSFDIIKKITKKEPMSVFLEAFQNIKPLLEVRARRIGGQNYQIPSEISAERAQILTLRWLVKYAKLRKEHTMEERLAAEIIDAGKKLGASFKKKEDTHKMAEANKAFAHYN